MSDIKENELKKTQLEAGGITLGFPDRTLVEDLSFTVQEGDYLCILGENGAGKTTLMKTLLGLKKPLKGEVIFKNGLTHREIGYLPQQTEVQRDFPATVEEIVMSGCQGRLHHRFFYNAEDRRLALKNMERMKIADIRKSSYRALSGGQQQRVLLARTLTAADKLLLLDEPVSGLDPVVTEDMYELIHSLNEEGITIIMISHDLSASLKYGNKILHIGSKCFFGSVEEYEKSGTGRRFIAEKEGMNFA